MGGLDGGLLYLLPGRFGSPATSSSRRNLLRGDIPGFVLLSKTIRRNRDLRGLGRYLYLDDGGSAYGDVFTATFPKAHDWQIAFLAWSFQKGVTLCWIWMALRSSA